LSERVEPHPRKSSSRWPQGASTRRHGGHLSGRGRRSTERGEKSALRWACSGGHLASLGSGHRLEDRIRAHILICWLALLLVRLCERQAGDTWRNLRREHERLHLVTLAGAAGEVQQTTRPTREQRDILAQLQIDPPPRLTSLTPA